MRGSSIIKWAIAITIGLRFVGPGSAIAIDIVRVTVGQPGNAPDTRHEPAEEGQVDYTYDIGMFEVTAGQYTEFLNAVAVDDTYDLFDLEMWVNLQGCRILRLGTPGDRVYSVASQWADRPVNFVSWASAARFANWMHNGQPTGAQTLATTEDGSYLLDGATTFAELSKVTRKPDATFVIPSNDEWYKAAYHANDSEEVTYFEYPTGSDDVLSNQLIDPDPGNNANFHEQTQPTIGSPYWRTRAGEFENSASPHGTFDQGGNVAEWNEAQNGILRGARGGAYNSVGVLLAAERPSIYFDPSGTYSFIGFRLAVVPQLPCYFDGDGDDDVDLDDYGLFRAAATGPLATVDPYSTHRAGPGEVGCSFDRDSDGDVDLIDFGQFQFAFTGPQ